MGSLKSITKSTIYVPDYRVFDSHPMLLNCLNGTYDLAAHKFRPTDRADMLTKTTGVSYDPDADCKRWKQLILEVSSGDEDTARYLQQCVGVSLTGDTNEHLFFILRGNGRNGKSVFLETIADLLGDYGTMVSTDTIMASAKINKGQARPDVAKLAGVRCCHINETQQGSKLDEALIKQMCGADSMTARHLYKEEFTFKGQFKLWIRTNHQINIRGTDNAIWDRVKEVPFDLRLASDQIDKTLPERFKAQAPGILNWAIKGLKDYQANGLLEPDKVKKATNHRIEMDVLARFLNEQCDTGQITYTAGKNELWGAFKAWCDQNNHWASDSRAFRAEMLKRGYQESRDKHGEKWHGVKLRSVPRQSSAGFNDADEVFSVNS
jgi:putative DNA primase/helicase